MRHPLMVRRLAAVVVAVVLALPLLISGQATPPPFNEPTRSYTMPCAYCHDLHAGTGTAIIYRGTAAIEAMCMSCHNGIFTDPVTGRSAVEVAAHDNPGSDYGTYKISCLGCHNPHRNATAAGSDAVNPPDGYGNWMLIADWVPEADSADRLARIRRPAIVDVNGDNGGTGRRRFQDDVMDGFYCSNVADISPPAGSGAVRASGVVTVTTIASHRYSAGDSVWLGGVDDTSFNGGPFVIATTPTARTFTFAQTGANATSGNGIARTKIYDRPECKVDPPSATDLTRTVVFYDNRTPASAAVNQWAQPEMVAPTAPGARWYNGACNVCHTRTSHHRRDNSLPAISGSADHDHNIVKACHDCHYHNKGWIK